MRILLLLFLVSISFVGLGQKYFFTSYSTAEGLPQSQVTCITQDGQGYLWVGTIGGLSRFNGEEFVSYTSRGRGLLNNRIVSLSYFDNTVWVGHDGGISSIKGDNVQKYEFKGDDKSRSVDQIIRFNDRLVICSDRGGLYELSNGELIAVDMQISKSGQADKVTTKFIRAAHIHDNVLYLATKEGMVGTRDLKRFDFLEEFGDHSFSGVVGYEKEIIATTYDSLLMRKNLLNNRITVSNPDKIASIRGCYLDADKAVWLTGFTGIVCIPLNNESFSLDQGSGLPVNAVECVFQDKYKNIWIGSGGKGLSRFPGLKFKYFDKKSGYISDLFMCGFNLDNGDSYFGTFDRGILRKRKGEAMERFVPESITSYVWTAIDNVDGKHWFGAQQSLISIDELGKISIFEKEQVPGLPGIKIVSFERIDDNSMYVGGSEGVSLYQNGEFTKVGTRNEDYLGTVRDMEFYNGELYCVSNLGMFVYRNGDFQPIESTMGRVHYSIVADESGVLWVGAGSGLYYYKDGVMEQLRLLQDDPRANVVNFMNYKDGELYVGTNNGLLIITTKGDEYKVRRFGPGDGIPDVETNLNSSFFDKDGGFWFGTSRGFVNFNNKVSGIGVRKPLVHLKSMLLNFSPFDFSDYDQKLLAKGEYKKMLFSFNKNNFVFEFDGVALVNHDELQYQFMLMGLNDSWSPLSSSSTIAFTNLDAGEYELMVKAVDLDGRDSEVLKIPFVIEEAYYKTWWFITLCVLALGGIILIIFRFRLRRVQQINENEMLSYKARMLSLEQKSLNASMNRHFIFNSLNSIQYFINTRDRLSANKYLTNFAKLIRRNLDSASLEDNRITLEDEISRIELYLSLESMRFKDRFDYVITTNEIDLEKYEIPAMLLQPFIENSIIHGILPEEDVKGLIEVTMEMKGEILEILIRDNGIGVNRSISRKATITGDHRSQGMEITSKRIELMQEFSDQTMELVGPKEIIGKDGSINGTYVLLKLSPKNLED